MGGAISNMPRQYHQPHSSSISFGGDDAPQQATPSRHPNAHASEQAPWGTNDTAHTPAAAPVTTDAPFATNTMAQALPTVAPSGGTRTASRGGGGLQNCDNTIGDVPSVKLHHAPGGTSSISFGDEVSQFAPQARQAPQSAPFATQDQGFTQRNVAAAPQMENVNRVTAQQFHNAQSPFATDAPQAGGTRTASRGAGGLQNCDNHIGDVPSVKLHHNPGGSSTISFGCDDNSSQFERAPGLGPPVSFVAPQASGVPVNRTASRNTGGLQNVGNTIGDVPSVKLHAPPGGASTISFG